MKIKYSIVSRGSERYINHGYMGITEKSDNKQYLLDVDHGAQNIDKIKNYLCFEPKYTIQNIALSRFELISEILFQRIKISDNILICGLGGVGFSCLINLLKRGYKNISIYSRNYLSDLKEIEEYFDVKIKKEKFITGTHDTYIDATGDTAVLNDIMNNIDFFKNIIILGTYHDTKFQINPILINRKSLSIYGGHEFNGVSLEYRNKLYRNLLEENKLFDKIMVKYISINNYSEENLKQILNKKKNYIDIFKY